MIKYLFILILINFYFVNTGFSLDSERKFGGFYTEEKIKTIRQKCATLDWAIDLKEKAIKKADFWNNLDDTHLWAMVPGQDLPRCIDVTFDRNTEGSKSLGCLKCGDDIREFGNYPYQPDMKEGSWKLTCPSCKVVFPTNDFKKYYRSGINKRGLFEPEKADRSLLYNEDHPDPDDPLHKYGVDDGFGYIDENGREHKFIGYYTWKHWQFLNEGLESLSNAFLYTGEKKYALKAAILLDRIADVYPDMDWQPYAEMGWYHSDGGRNMGKIGGSIWETTTVQVFAESYDKIISGTVNNAELFEFLSKQSEIYQLPKEKGTRQLFIQNVDHGILKTGYDAVLNEQIRGNQGMHQLTVAKCALALNSEPETSAWLDWIFDDEGGKINHLMTVEFDRDGTSDEGGVGYTLIWGNLVYQLATWLASYPQYTENDIFRDFPNFNAAFLAAYQMAVLGKAIPNVGDSGSTGLVSNTKIKPQFIAEGYHFTKDTTLAIAAYRANGYSVKGLFKNINLMGTEKSAQQIQNIGEMAGPRLPGGRLMSGFGLAILEFGDEKNGTALAKNYGRTIKHGHWDVLNFDLFAFGKWITPDLGYPEFATNWPSRLEWTQNTLSHNTVVVDQSPQKPVYGGKSTLFIQLPDFGVVEVDGRNAYPQVDEYRRTMFLIPVGKETTQNAYAVDLFKVKGGNEHLYSFHGPPSKMDGLGIELQKQATGTYAGENIPKTQQTADIPLGYSYLYDVSRNNNPPDNFILDWTVDPDYMNAQKDIHLRLHVLTDLNEVAIAKGDPPQNKPGNPKQLDYALLKRSGDNLESSFLSVIEPYRKSPGIEKVERWTISAGTFMGLTIRLKNGLTDHILFNSNPEELINLGDTIAFQGHAAFIREKGNQVIRSVLVEGTLLEFLGNSLNSQGAYKGKIVSMNKGFDGGGIITVDNQDIPTDQSLLGKHIHIQSQGIRDATYTIHKIFREEGKTLINCGPITFIQGRKTPGSEKNNAFTYDFEEGDTFSIPLYESWKINEKNN